MWYVYYAVEIFQKKKGEMKNKEKNERNEGSFTWTSQIRDEIF